MSSDARSVYIDIRHRYNGRNNGGVLFSHLDAAASLNTKGWQRPANALAELQHYGFIKCRHKGEPGPHVRLASEWQLTVFDCGGQPAAKTFMRWQGEVFDPPYKGRLGKPTKEKREAEKRDSEKQLATAKLAVEHRHVSGANSEFTEFRRVKSESCWEFWWLRQALSGSCRGRRRPRSRDRARV